MTLTYADRVQETTATTGTGTYALAGAVTGFQSFAAVGNGNTCYYGVTDGTDWEVGLGTYTLSGTTLARTSVLASTNTNTAVNWGAGTKAIWLDFPALVASYLAGGTTGSGPVVLGTSPTLTTPNIGAAAGSSLSLSALNASSAVATDASKNLVSVTNTGTGNNVLATSPTLTTPVLGVATATSINKTAITAPATASTLAIADGKTLTASNSLTLAGTDATTMTFPGTSSTVLTAGNTATLTKGFSATPNNLGNITSFTVDPTLGNIQYGTNHGAATWTAPTSDCEVDILVSNDASAGATTFSGFTVGSNTGTALDTVNGHRFWITIKRANGVSSYSVYGLF